MREVVLDTETTGLSPEEGHRLVEIGCIELVNHVPTGSTFHTYLNPERAMSAGAYNVHGLSDDFLKNQPMFAAVADGLLAFIGDATVIIHNAAFDLGFINAELARASRDPFRPVRLVDTLELARRRFPGAPASLDALCKRFAIDATARTKHGALLDAELLSLVYLELVGGRQTSLGLTAATVSSSIEVRREVVVRPPRPHAPTGEELAAHAAFVARIDNAVWLQA